MGGRARHLDRDTSRLQEPRRGGPGSLTSVSQSADTFHVRGEARGTVGSCVASHAGVGTNCIERCVLPNEVRKERGQRAEMEAGRRTLPGVPKYLYGMSVPSRASAGWLPRASSTHCVGCPTSSLLSLANTVGGGGRRSRRLALVAGSRGLGRGGLAGGPPRPSCPSVGAGRRYQGRLAWSVGDGRVLRVQKGRRQPSISSRCHRDPKLPSIVILVGKGLFFPVCLLSFSPPVFSVELGVGRGLLTLSNFPPKMQAGTVTLGLHQR